MFVPQDHFNYQPETVRGKEFLRPKVSLLVRDVLSRLLLPHPDSKLHPDRLHLHFAGTLFKTVEGKVYITTITVTYGCVIHLT